jgi:hypothetical protein
MQHFGRDGVIGFAQSLLQQREKLAAMFGGGFASSSDGQFFRAGGFGRDASSINAHYGDEPGVKFYTHLSDRYAPLAVEAIGETSPGAGWWENVKAALSHMAHGLREAWHSQFWDLS